jgi:hypothetical protein
MIKIVVIAQVPDDKAQALCQHIRDFDVRVPGCTFNVFAEAPDKSVEEIADVLNVKPPLAHKKVMKPTS